MSQENVEIVRRAHQAWNADDLDGFLLSHAQALEAAGLSE